MKTNSKIALLVTCLTTLSSTSWAQDLAQTFEDISQSKQSYLAAEQNLAVVAPFAQEWDRLATGTLGKIKAGSNPSYTRLNEFDYQYALDQINYVATNDEFVTFIESAAAEQSFMRVYSQAHTQGSAIAAFTPEDAFQLWATSKFTLQPQWARSDIKKIGNDVDVQRCLWIIWCPVPPKTLTK